MKEYIPAFILVLVGIGFYYFQPAVMIESSEEIRIDDKPIAKNNLETNDSEDMQIGVTESPDEKRLDDKPVSVIEKPEETPKEDKPLAKKKPENKEPQDRPVTVIERPEEKRIEPKPIKAKPIAKRSFAIKESENKEIYGDRFPPRYLTNNWSTNEGPMKLMQGDDMWVRGLYYFDNNNVVRGRVTTRYIQKDGRKILSGYWFQDRSDQRCDYPRFGSDYWGRLTFNFQGDSFTGVWSYCDDKPKPHYQWNGKLT